MPTLTQRSFSSGELDPALQGRVDTNKYASGVKTARNAYVMKSGGLSNRMGTEFVNEVSDSSKPIRLIKFVFNVSQTYVLEFGHLYMRVHQKGAPITLTATSITSISNANPAVVTKNAHGFSTGDEIYLSGIIGPSELSNRSFKVVKIDANSFSLKDMYGVAISTVNSDTFVSGVMEKTYQVATPYTYEQLPNIKYVQSADVLILVHPEVPPQKLSRLSHNNWVFSSISFMPSIPAPLAPSISGGTGSAVEKWVITAVGDNYEESLASPESALGPTPTAANPVTVSWSAVAGAIEYNIYRIINGTPGFVGVSQSLSFKDIIKDPDPKATVPQNKPLFDGPGKYPSSVTFIQQRLAFASTDNEPEKIWMSRTGKFFNFTKSYPLQDDDSVAFTMAGRQVNEVRHMLDLGEFVVLTEGGEFIVRGDANNTLTPTSVSPRQQSYNGSADIAPIPIDGSALYVQARGSIVRDLAFSQDSNGYRGNDLTVFSAHLFKGKTIRDWDYQQNFDSIVWVVREDGIMLSCTYLKEHQVVGWTRHEFDNGFVENVCVVPEGDIDAVYVVVRREINGQTKRYIERFKNRFFTDEVNAAFMDSHLTYDGRNLDVTHSMTLSNGDSWDHEDILTLISSKPFFKASDEGNQIHGQIGDEVLRLTILEVVSSTVVRVTAHKTVVPEFRNVPWVIWSRAVDKVSGLHHLEGKEVSVFADRFVAASPYNDSYTVVTVENGSIQLDKCYAVIHVGLPYTMDIETLDIDVPQGETLQDKKIAITDVTIKFEHTRGIYVGAKEPDGADALEDLNEMKLRSFESMDQAIRPFSGNKKIQVRSDYKTNGRIFLRQVDPVPVQILSISPSGLIPIRGGQ